MLLKKEEKRKAIDLRKRGYSYSEIIKNVPVSKSTLSLWLRDVGLAKKQKQRITRKKVLAMKRGADVVRKKRIEKSNKIKKDARNNISNISKKELWLMGIMLYWAEGAKEKTHRVGERVQLMNTDKRILCIFKKWLIDCCKIIEDDIIYDIYLHKNSFHDTDRVRDYWRKEILIPANIKIPVYYKNNKIKTVRKNIGESYYGVCRIKVKKSTDLNRKIAGWIDGISNNIL